MRKLMIATKAVNDSLESAKELTRKTYLEKMVHFAEQ